jgi:arylsulfatase A-like enzyme
MNRRQFLGSLGAASIQPGQAKRPNIVFVFSDDHAYQAISAYSGGRLNHTPNIDRIARQGMRFDQCLVTNSICGPSRAVILTGKYSHLNGFIDNSGAPFDGSQQTFPKLLRSAGYQTAIFGKWHLVTDPTGFDAWEVLPGQGSYYNPDFLTPAGRKRREGYCTDIVTDLSLDWLANGRDQSKPFMLMCQHKAPHRNWMPAPDKLHLYDGVTFPEPETLFDNYEHRASPAHKQLMEIGKDMVPGSDLKIFSGEPGVKELAEYHRMTEAQKRMWDAAYRPRNEAFYKANPQGRELTRWKYQRYMQDYLRCIASVDDSVGRIQRYLDATGQAENTIFIYCSDQGFYLGEHGWFDKRWIYEESVRTPLLVNWPGVTRPGTTNNSLVSNLDLAETFLDAAGVPVPADMQGRSLRPILSGQTPQDWRKSFYYHYYEFPGPHSVARHCGVRTGRYTLAHYYQSNEWELFDREKDPRELRSVYSDSAYAPVVKELKSEMTRLRAELKVPDVDPVPARPPRPAGAKKQ